jgi:ligand-binding sensor domain-containing protein
MNLKKITCKVILFFGILITFSSCAGQNTSEGKSETQEVQEKFVSIGEIATEVDERVMVIFQDKNNHYWFGGGENGVYKYDGETLVLYSTKDGLYSNAVLGIQEDIFGNIYFDTSEGICKFDGQKFVTLQVKEGNVLMNEWKLEPNDLWFRMGWNSNGPYRFDGNFLYELAFPKIEQADKFYAQYPNASFNPYGIYSLYKDSKGSVWFGTSSLGVCRYDGTTISWLYEEQMTTTSDGGALGIRSVLEDKDGIFWFTNTRYRYDISPGHSERNGTSYINYKKKNGIGYTDENGKIDFPYFMSIAEDNNGDLWMVTYDDGVWRNDGEKLIHYPIKVDEKDVLLFSIYKDKQGVLWLGSHNAGAFKFNGKTFEKFEILQ